MRILTRRKIGILLLAISTVALVIFFALGLLRGDWHYVGSGSSGEGGGWAVYEGKLGVNEYYFIPIFLCGVVGAFCVLWPTRKPPKLNQ